MADGLLSNILNFIDQRKQASMAGLGLLASNPQEYLTGRAEQLRDFTRAQEAGLPAERAQLRGLLVSPEQQAAQQYANQQLQDLVLGFTGNVKPTGLLSKAGQQLPAVPETMYHGTASDIQAFRPGNTVYVSPSPKFAESYAGTQSPNIMPLRADVTKPFNYESAADIQKLAETYKKLHGEDLFSKKTISSSGGEMKLSQLDKNPISQRLKSGDWTIIEDKKVQEAIKKAGFDAFYIEEGGVKNLGVYDPTKLKSVFSSGENVKPAGLLGTEAAPAGNIKPTSNLINEAHQVASKNAEKMLGLPPGNTAMDRARAMGFNVENPVYHGTNADIQSMNVQGKGKTSGAGAFVTNNPVIAETYVSGIGTPGGNIMPLFVKDKDLLTTNARGKNWADIYTNQLSVKGGGKKYSLDELGLDKNSATTTDELGMIANQLGKKGIVIKNVKDAGPNSHIYRAKEYLKEKYGVYPNEDWSNISGKQFDEARTYLDKLYKSQKSDITAVQDPTLLRSRFAAFDPARANEADLLAGVIPFGLLSGKDQLESKKEKKSKK